MSGATLDQNLADLEWLRQVISAEPTLISRAEVPRGPFDIEGQTVANANGDSLDALELSFLSSQIKTLRPKNILELGTNIGISSSAMALALQQYSPTGILHTLDASPSKHVVAQELHQSLNLANIRRHTGKFMDLLPSLLPGLGPLDFTFIDGDHTHPATVKYFCLIAKHTRPGGTLILDDIQNYSKEMDQSWSAIQRHPRCYKPYIHGKLGVVHLN